MDLGLLWEKQEVNVREVYAVKAGNFNSGISSHSFSSNTHLFCFTTRLCSCKSVVQFIFVLGIPTDNCKEFHKVGFDLAYFSVIYLNMQMLCSSLW